MAFGFAELAVTSAILKIMVHVPLGSGLLFFGSFGFAELVRLKPSSVLLEGQKK